MPNKTMKTGSTSRLIKIHIKHAYPLEWLQFKRLATPRVGDHDTSGIGIHYL